MVQVWGFVFIFFSTFVSANDLVNCPVQLCINSPTPERVSALGTLAVAAPKVFALIFNRVPYKPHTQIIETTLDQSALTPKGIELVAQLKNAILANHENKGLAEKILRINLTGFSSVDEQERFVALNTIRDYLLEAAALKYRPLETDAQEIVNEWFLENAIVKPVFKKLNQKQVSFQLPLEFKPIAEVLDYNVKLEIAPALPGFGEAVLVITRKNSDVTMKRPWEVEIVELETQTKVLVKSKNGGFIYLTDKDLKNFRGNQVLLLQNFKLN